MSGIASYMEPATEITLFRSSKSLFPLDGYMQYKDPLICTLQPSRIDHFMAHLIDNLMDHIMNHIVNYMYLAVHLVNHNMDHVKEDFISHPTYISPANFVPI